MRYPNNGRTIKIPVHTTRPQLPAAEEETLPMLTGPAITQADAVDGASEGITEAVDWKELASRLRAEAESVRKRSERRAQNRIREERRRLLSRLLTVIDNLERALVHADENDALKAGVQLILDDLLGQLAQEGVEPIHAQGRSFDPALHEAVATDGSRGDTVVEVLETGYTLNGELLRPARVVVGSPTA
jgi:molecular chaperone GrpE